MSFYTLLLKLGNQNRHNCNICLLHEHYQSKVLNELSKKPHVQITIFMKTLTYIKLGSWLQISKLNLSFFFAFGAKWFLNFSSFINQI